MATLREFILQQSTLPTGNSVRNHIQNPGGSIIYLVLSDGLEVELDSSSVDAHVGLEYDVEICI